MIFYSENNVMIEVEQITSVVSTQSGSFYQILFQLKSGKPIKWDYAEKSLRDKEFHMINNFRYFVDHG